MSRAHFDPFREHTRRRTHTHHVLGSRVRFVSESAELLGLADEAFGRLPRNGVAHDAPSFMIRLVPVASDARDTRRSLTLAAGASWLCGSVGDSAFAVMSPESVRRWWAFRRGCCAIVTPPATSWWNSRR